MLCCHCHIHCHYSGPPTPTPGPPCSKTLHPHPNAPHPETTLTLDLPFPETPSLPRPGRSAFMLMKRNVQQHKFDCQRFTRHQHWDGCLSPLGSCLYLKTVKQNRLIADQRIYRMHLSLQRLMQLANQAITSRSMHSTELGTGGGFCFGELQEQKHCKMFGHKKGDVIRCCVVVWWHFSGGRAFSGGGGSGTFVGWHFGLVGLSGVFVRGRGVDFGSCVVHV